MVPPLGPRLARVRSLPLTLPLILALGLVSACKVSPAPNEPRRPSAPVAILGIDGLEWSVVSEMIRADRLPNLARLIDRGVAGKLSTLEPSRSPALWTTVATGMLPSTHGIDGFTRAGAPRDAPDGALYTNRDRKVKALWNILDDAELTSYVIGWWMTFPVEPIHGLMIAQVNTQAIGSTASGGLWKGTLVEAVPDQVHPVAREEEVLAVIPRVDKDLPAHLKTIFGDGPPQAHKPPVIPAGAASNEEDNAHNASITHDNAAPTRHTGHVDDSDATAHHLWRKSRWALRADAIYAELVLQILHNDEPFDLLMAYFGGTDVLGHRFWRYAYPDGFENPPSARAIKRYGRVIHDYYAWIDSLIGELAAELPQETILIVMSDHGMGPRNKDASYESSEKGRALISGGHGKASDAVLIVGRAGVLEKGWVAERELGDPSDRVGENSAASRANNVPKLGSLADIAPSVLALLDLPIGRDMHGQPIADLLEFVRPEPYPLRFVDSHTPPTWKESRSLATTRSPGEKERLDQLRTLGYIE